jgi:WD40 repeat protein
MTVKDIVEEYIQQLMPEWSKRKVQNAFKKFTKEVADELVHRVFDVLVNSTDTQRREAALYLLKHFPKNVVTYSIYHRDMKWLVERLLLDPNPPIADIMPRFFLDPSGTRYIYDLWCRENAPHLLALLQKSDFFALLAPERTLRVLLMAGRLEDINVQLFNNVYHEFLQMLASDNSELEENAHSYLLRLPDDFLLTFQPSFFGTFTAPDRHFDDSYTHLLKAFRRSVGKPVREKLRLLLPVHGEKTTVIQQICEEWLETRAVELEEFLPQKTWLAANLPRLDVIVALKTNNLDLLQKLDGNLLIHFVVASHDTDPVIRHRAQAWLEKSPEKDLEQLAKIWLTERQSFLYEIFVKRNFLPSELPEARVRLALKMGRQNELRVQPTLVKVIAIASEDNDKAIADAARQLLPPIVDRPARVQAIIEAIFIQDLPFAQQLAVERDYAPDEISLKILFYFLTGQFDRYESLDYDLRILKQSYETADRPLRKRLARLVRQSGRTEYLSVIAGSVERSRAHTLTPEEAEILVGNLARNADWEKLWRLVFELPLHWSIEAVRKLQAADFMPQHTEEAVIFRRLQELANGQPITTEPELLENWKIIEPIQDFKLEARVNDLALAPGGTKIAVALDNFKIRIRRLANDEPDVIVDGFRRAPYHVAFVNEHKLVCAESVPGSGLENATTSTYLWQKETGLKKMGEHAGFIYELQLLDENLALSCGQDSNVVLWNLRAGMSVQKASVFKVRRLCVAAERRWFVAVTATGYRVCSLPEFQLVRQYAKVSNSATGFTIWAATLTPDETGLLLSRPDAKMSLIVIDPKQSEKFTLEPFGETYKRNRPVIQLFSFPETDWVLIVYADGTLEFMEWATRKIFYRYNLPLGTGGKLTAIKFTTDKKQLLTGDSGGNVRLWNFRPVDLRRFFSENLASRRGTDLDFLANFERNYPDLPTSLAVALQYIRLILEHRSRFEIELDDFVAIEASDFDIELAE